MRTVTLRAGRELSGSRAQGSRIKQARERAGVRQAELAYVLGVSPREVSLFESGKADVTVDRAYMIADLLHVPSEWILFGD